MVATAALILAGTGLAIAAGGTFASLQSQKKAASAQRQANELSNRRSKRQAIRESLIKRAETVAVANAFNSSDSSGVAGATASLGSQLGSNLGFSSQLFGLSQKQASASQRASLFSGIGSLGGSIFNLGLAGGAIGDAKSLLAGSNQSPTALFNAAPFEP